MAYLSAALINNLYLPVLGVGDKNVPVLIDGYAKRPMKSGFGFNPKPVANGAIASQCRPNHPLEFSYAVVPGVSHENSPRNVHANVRRAIQLCDKRAPILVSALSGGQVIDAVIPYHPNLVVSGVRHIKCP